MNAECAEYAEVFSVEIERFTIDVSQEALDDLAVRLAGTRWPDEISGAGWDYGTNVGYLRELVEYWQTEYDWRAQERALNEFEHFRAGVDGLGIHFIHARGKGPEPFPLIISHGWPGSVVEMLKIIPMLTDPAAHGGDAADSFDVVVPSLPGYGFSDKPVERGMSNTRIAGMWHKLMTEGLGYRRFGAQGGDWGGMISSRLGFDFPESVAGVHVNLVTGVPAFRGAPDPPLTEAEQEFIRQARRWFDDEGGYFHIQRTKPQTLGLGLNDSPVGLAAWIIEKFRTWSDCGGNPESSYTRDELLTNIMVYWVNQSGRVVGPALLREPGGQLAVPARGAGGGALRRRTVPGGDRPSAPRVGRAHPQRAALDGDAPGRPLRGDGAARAAGRGHPRVFPYPQITPFNMTRRTRRLCCSKDSVCLTCKPQSTTALM